ncbi:TAP-like protein-domain-containing protein [Mycena maculata]|uniref:TAP-like protein-domain-containing protein n=1 Tax=Mycena maculata TaxID=230809 RepID=A0AAD7KGJ8_9AGAR|nr:TAP-like protein-domain-containing protein [Mycena maculata]
MTGAAIRAAQYTILVIAAWFLFKSISDLAPYPLDRKLTKTAARSSCEDSSPFTAQDDEFSWESIVPSEELVWHECYSDRQCARLKVPLDYSNPDATSAAIAMIRVHSIVPHNSSDYRGPILINPGGPGGSGVDVVQTRGAEISTIVGPEFDVIGFDPRGISRSTPRVSFFESRSEREVWLRSPDNLYALSMNASADALPRAWAQGIIEGQLAGQRDDGSLRFINTDHTARDMLRIVQAHGREKLQYWGFSYGSILGATFAAMFPDNVERLVIDGVADSENYFATEWSNNLVDTEKTWGAFVDGCVAAGPQGCAFFSPTATELEANVVKIYASLRARPIPVRTNTSFGVVDYSMMRSVIFQSLYSPYAKFPVLAQALAELSAGNGTALFKMSERAAFKCGCDLSEFRFETVFDGGIAVRCNDGKRMPGSYEDVLEHYQNMSKLSSWADVWQSLRLACAAWPELPKNHFQGPFVANTSFPLLLVSTTADPVTPLAAAKKISQGFAGSVVLTQDSPGHCSISGPSICTQKYIREYFLKGTLPEPGTVCPVISSPFPSHDYGAAADAQAVLAPFAGDRELLEAVIELAKTFDFRFLGGL